MIPLLKEKEGRGRLRMSSTMQLQTIKFKNGNIFLRILKTSLRRTKKPSEIEYLPKNQEIRKRKNLGICTAKLKL
jgi:hypothetical protein